MKTILAICLIFLAVSSSFAVQVKKPSLSAMKKIDSLINNKNTWSSVMLNLAALQVKAGGPLTALIEALEQVVNDLNEKLDHAYEEYDRRTAEHEAEVRRLNDLIFSAQTDIANTQAFLTNVLYVQKSQLETDIAYLRQTITQTEQYIEETTNQRVFEHNQWETRVVEHNEAIAAIDEALQLLSTLKEGGGSDLSLVQTKKLQKTMENVQNKIKGKNFDITIVKALVILASTNFANQDALNNVANLMLKVRESLSTSLVTEQAEEEANQQAFVADMAQKEYEINSMTIEISNKTNELNQTIERIADNEAFLESRKFDLQEFTQDLVDENAAFDRITESFNDLVAQFQSELAACDEALGVLNGAEFEGYISDRLTAYGGDVVIDQAHGQKINTADWSV